MSSKQGVRMAEADLPLRSSSINYRAPRVSLTLADFDIVRRIGDGSFSEVMQVRHKKTGIEYALKMVDKHLIVRHRMVAHIKTERNILDGCDFPGIARLYFTFQDEASLYLGLELCPNGELYDQIRVAGRLPVARAQFYAAEVVAMLEYLQTKRVVHRDLKPENLLLDVDGRLKLIDFGSAMLLKEGGQEAEREEGQRKTSLVGTADYVAPEVLSNDAVTGAVDLWALGCIIFQMLIGKAPFKAASEYLTFQRIADCAYAVPPECELPADAEDLIRRLLVLEPSARLGAGEEGLPELKSHPFFAGVDWASLREQPAPAFARPQRHADVDDVGLDWEMTSLMASLPVQYGHEAGSPQRWTPGVPIGKAPRRSRSTLSIASRDCGGSGVSEASLATTDSVASSPERQASGGGAHSSGLPPLKSKSWSPAVSPSKRSSSVRRMSPFATDLAQAAAVTDKVAAAAKTAS